MENACYKVLVQKLKATWIEKGDSNTKYFHSIIKSRQVKNKVIKISDADGILFEETADIQGAFLSFHHNLMGSFVSTIPASSNVIQMGKFFSLDHHNMLLTPITEEEAMKVMFSIPNHKPARPDVFTSALFKDVWDIVGGPVIDVITDFFYSGSELSLQ
ncbi:uncharacterized protein LOC141613658 [Silene latifolia]|uniref:uncharacterized protein LOC141613658 n=1 Tax=Silene latifolia TaxID=37657 RepID=UPI003D774405